MLSVHRKHYICKIGLSIFKLWGLAFCVIHDASGFFPISLDWFLVQQRCLIPRKTNLIVNEHRVRTTNWNSSCPKPHWCLCYFHGLITLSFWKMDLKPLQLMKVTVLLFFQLDSSSTFRCVKMKDHYLCKRKGAFDYFKLNKQTERVNSKWASSATKARTQRQHKLRPWLVKIREKNCAART